ncbi:MAG TPA: septum formation inhibitor Maf [Firmicutes bacterium]|nr:septum formation inhibitor Maf [Bacillota bacterium]
MRYVKTNLILASHSPRRADILRQLGLHFTTQASGIDESKVDNSMNPMDFVMNLALRKAQKVSRFFHEGLVIGADTVVVIEGRILGKPASKAEAIAMLSDLSGKEHSVFTGLALLEVSSARKLVSVVETKVQFRSLDKIEIENYVATGEPLDKAGAYGIQGKGAILVEKIDGCYYNVVGLPVAKLVTMLKEFGVSIG